MQQPNHQDNLIKCIKIDRYYKWMYNKFSQYVGRRVIDIGAGIGNMMQFYIHNVDIAIGTDIFEGELNILQQRFDLQISQKSQLKTMILDIEKDNVEHLKQHNLDTAICVNVLEHIENDSMALGKMKDIVVSGGKIILLVPAFSILYNHMDKAGGHYRRYDKGQLCLLAKASNFKIIKNCYFNMFGILPYAIKGKFGKKRDEMFSDSLGETSSRLYNIMSCILEPFEKVVKVPFGISELIVLEK